MVSCPAKTMAKPRKGSRKPAKKKAAPKRARRVAKITPADELLREELVAARGELKRVALEENVVRRELEAALSNERNANARLREELDAVRLDLKTALADLEIARTEAQRESTRALSMGRELAAALEGQRLAEHAVTTTRERLFALQRELKQRDEEEEP